MIVFYESTSEYIHIFLSTYLFICCDLIKGWIFQILDQTKSTGGVWNEIRCTTKEKDYIINILKCENCKLKFVMKFIYNCQLQLEKRLVLLVVLLGWRVNYKYLKTVGAECLQFNKPTVS